MIGHKREGRSDSYMPPDDPTLQQLDDLSILAVVIIT